MAGTGSTADVDASVRAWLATFSGHVARVDFASARPMFDDGVIGFGTWSELLVGADDLEAKQWRKVWGTIADFAIDVDGSSVLASDDGSMAVAVAPWASTGFAEDGSAFDRPGRATLVLRREGPGGEWRCVHSHFSLGRDVPQRSYGSPAARR